ncbi:MAG TPA: hypothetical protein VF080_10885 [Solirubrobacteraceae bacterium]
MGRDGAVAHPALPGRRADGLEQRDGGWWPRFDAEVMARTLHDAEHDLHLDSPDEWRAVVSRFLDVLDAA